MSSLNWETYGVPRAIVILLCLLFCTPIAAFALDAPAELIRYRAAHKAMGVEFTITLYAPDEAAAQAAFAACWERIDELDGVMSDYDPKSELCRLDHAAPHADSVPVSDDLWRVLRLSKRYSILTDGAFDVTVGPLTRLWRRTRRQKELPDQEELDAALAAVDYRYIEFAAESKAVRLTQAKMRLDLGGIGQGFAADEVLRLLRERGLTRVLIDASGDVVAGEPPPGAKGWSVDIAPLDPKMPPTEHHSLACGAVSTSGDAYQFVEIAGQRYGHIVDPKTGLGLSRRSSVTVRARDGSAADALATALCVLGPERGLKLAEELPDIEALIVYLDGDQPVAMKTTGWGK